MKSLALRFSLLIFASICWLQLPVVAAEPVTDKKPATDWIELFNGKDLTGWVAEGNSTFEKGPEKTQTPVWSVVDGLLRCEGKGFGFLRYDPQQFSDFVYHVEFRMGKGCNSGIGIRHLKYEASKSTQTRPSISGYEIQLLDDAGKPAHDHGTASLYRYVAPKENAIKPAGEWNTIEIECVGPLIKITLNDKLILEHDQTTKPETAKKPLSGYVSVQNHGKFIEFKNIKIRDLTATKAQ